jgi:hypothetical protein
MLLTMNALPRRSEDQSKLAAGLPDQEWLQNA